jgi:hypothetical protein
MVHCVSGGDVIHKAVLVAFIDRQIAGIVRILYISTAASGARVAPEIFDILVTFFKNFLAQARTL